MITENLFNYFKLTVINTFFCIVDLVEMMQKSSSSFVRSLFPEKVLTHRTAIFKKDFMAQHELFCFI
jgi:hypothetical protein